MFQEPSAAINAAVPLHLLPQQRQQQLQQLQQLQQPLRLQAQQLALLKAAPPPIQASRLLAQLAQSLAPLWRQWPPTSAKTAPLALQLAAVLRLEPQVPVKLRAELE